MVYNIFMEKRIWDPKGHYIKAFLKQYKYWTLEVSYRQHTPGCFIIFYNKKATKIQELKKDALVELTYVMHEIETTLELIDKLSPDKFNYFQMGNALNHLHFHGIPRYKEKREVFGKTWNDKTFGHPPVWSSKDINDEMVLKVKELILTKLPK